MKDKEKQLKDRINKLEKENAIRQNLINDFSKENERIYNDIHKKELPLKQFAERLKEKAEYDYLADYNTNDEPFIEKPDFLRIVDETLKELIK